MTDGVEVIWGDSRVVLADMDAESVDSCCTDPPYALASIVERFGAEGAKPAAPGPYGRTSAGFMGETWDTGEAAHDPAFWAEVWRVLKPGGHLIAASGTRSYHRLACAIEDAGFEIRDMLAWLYSVGFPKSHDVARSIDRASLLCGVQLADGYQAACAEAEAMKGWGTALKPALEPIVLARKPLVGTVAKNVLDHGCGALNIDGSRVDRPDGAGTGYWPANVLHDGSVAVLRGFPEPEDADDGLDALTASGARFFYCAKADQAERAGSKHPTVKPVDLMAWLIRLVTPPGGLVLDPFAGSGATGMAALREGFRAVLIERERKYVTDIQRRIAHVSGADAPLFSGRAGE